MVETTRPPHPYEDSEDRHAREVASMYGLTPKVEAAIRYTCLLYTSPSPRDGLLSRMPSSA